MDRPVSTPAAVTVGAMNFGTRTPAAEAERIIGRALERGAALFDTANLYGNGESERICGKALHAVHRRGEARIATKVGLLRRGGKPEGLSAERIRAALDESLARLGIDHVDLYYLHAPDPATPVDETLDALQALLEAGRIRSWGVSNFAAWQLLELDLRCDARGMPRPAVSQVLYNLLVRQLDVEYFAFARRHPIHTTVYNPLAGGLLARDVSKGDAPPPGSRFDTNKLYRGRYWSARLIEQAGLHRTLAREAGIEPTQLAYAWLAQREGVHSILAGPATVAHLDAALDGAALTLPPDVLRKIEQLHRDFVGTDVSYAR